MNEVLKKVMLVDDSEADNYYSTFILNRLGLDVDVVSFQHAEAALDWLAGDGGDVDLILLDINMPRMTGFEFLQQYNSRALERGSDRVIVMLSTSLNPDDRKKANDFALVCEFMAKPITADAIRDIVERYFPKTS